MERGLTKNSMLGILRDFVVHTKENIKTKRKTFLIKPKFTRPLTHKMPTQPRKKLTTMASTQIIDRFWRELRSSLVDVSSKVSSCSLRCHVRSAQWVYWHRGDDASARSGRGVVARLDIRSSLVRPCPLECCHSSVSELLRCIQQSLYRTCG